MINNKLIPRTKEEIQKVMLEFKNLKNEGNYDVIKSRFFELFGIFPLTVMFNERQSLKHLPLFRACPAEKVIERGKAELSSYMGPPKTFEVGNGRANWNGRNVFYAGDSPYVTIVENKKLEVGQEYYIGQWEIDVDKISELEIPISYLTHNNITLDNPWNIIIPTKQKMIDKLILNFSVDEKEAELFIDYINEISNLFSEDNEQYNLSAFIADNTLYSKNNENFIPKLLIYPSVEAKKNSCNIAINPDFAEKYLRLIKVVKIKVSEVTNDSFKANFNTIGQVELGKIQFYHLNFERAKAAYKIDVFGCGCGVKFRIDDPEKLMVENEDNTRISIKELLDRESPKWVKDDDLLSYSEGVFSEKGIAIKKIIHSTIPLPNTIISRGGKEHNNLFCNIIIEQPFNYIKEGSTKYLSIANRIVNY